MRNPLFLVLVVAFLSTATLALDEVAAQEAASIQGAWVFTSEDDSNQRGLLVFTERHYSMMFVASDSERATYPDDREMTDPEILEAYGSFVANSGRYSMEGDEVTLEAYMAKNPNYMAGWPDNDLPFTIRVSGDTMTWETNGIAGLAETVTLRRVG